MFMINKKDITHSSNSPLYQQVINKILSLIEGGSLRKNDKLPSVNDLYLKLGVSRVTVVNAYSHLKKAVLLKPGMARDFMWLRNVTCAHNVFFCFFDAMNSYKEVLYRSFVGTLGPGYNVDVYFHYYNLKQFGRFVQNNLGDYSHYVVLPHFNEDVSKVLAPIPAGSLLLMDKDIPLLANVPAVFQHFKHDVFSCLSSGLYLLSKYKALHLIVDTGFQFIPQGILDGFTWFCKENGLEYSLKTDFSNKDILKNHAYVAISDGSLISVIQQAKQKKWQLGRDIGLVSYDDTPLKSILEGGITVITTDFMHMGQLAAKMIKERLRAKFENPARLVVRNSL
ncbi:MAG: GntR family transcriptional regulator [Bacteroidales bacterium]|nr:GntR family transcriptional regulator [Bacteroidales bacterium]